MKGNRLISKIIIVVIFLVGFGFILYPIVANEWNEICRRKVITVYDRQVEQSVEQGKISYEDEKRKADEYNKALRFNIMMTDLSQIMIIVSITVTMILMKIIIKIMKKVPLMKTVSTTSVLI